MQKDEEKNKKEDHDEEESSIKSDPGTTHTTDPQEHMKGPVSSLMKEIGEAFPDEDEDKSDNR
ncbi:MAG: hypothetical protein M3139_01190 [Bacteroidota bacterium]|nr:hypothetical protein [Bacteroidota bacterium]